MKQCPFCRIQVPDGASDCTGCGAYEERNSEASSTLTKYFYMVGVPMIIYETLNFLSTAPFLSGLIKPGSTIINVAATILILGFLWKFYLPWSNKIMWYRKH